MGLPRARLRSGTGSSRVEGGFGWWLTNACVSLPLRLDRRILHLLSDSPLLSCPNLVGVLPSPLLRDFFGRQPFVSQVHRGLVIKHVLVAGSIEQIIPTGWGVIRKFHVGDHCREPIIKHHVKLRADVQGAIMQYDGCGAGVLGTETKKHSAAGSRLPARNFLSIMEIGLQDVSGTSPSMEIGQLVARHARSGHNIDWSNPCIRVRSVIVDERCVVHCHWPEGQILYIRPPNMGVNHHRACH